MSNIVGPVLGAQKNLLNEMVLLSTKNMLKLKNIYNFRLKFFCSFKKEISTLSYVFIMYFTGYDVKYSEQTERREKSIG